MKKTSMFFAAIMSLVLVGCATDGQNQYSAADIGQEINVQFGTIIAKREVKIQDKSTGLGGVGGGIAGAAAGSAFGQGSGQGYAALGGLIVGAIAGAVAENALQNRTGIEYTIHKTSGHTVTIVQNIASGDVPLGVGQKVMIQTSGKTEIKDGDTKTTQGGAGYVRVLPVDDLPAEVTKKSQKRQKRSKSK